MNKELKAILIGVGFCIVGAVLLDLHVYITGATTLTIGFFTAVFGPLAVNL